MSALPVRIEAPELVLVPARCQCQPGRSAVPIKVVAEVATQVRTLLQGTSMAECADEPLLTYRCRRCSGLVTLTLRSLALL